MPDYGPFAVDPTKVSDLGGSRFGQFVSRLVASEQAVSEVKGSMLDTLSIENMPDGGVDASLRNAEATSWVPPGDSAWQFKAGDLPPAKCKVELEGATFALEILRAGGKYRLALGASLTAAQNAARKKALIEKALELGLSVSPDTFEVLSADHLARWAEGHPALAADPILGGPGTAVQPFELWASSGRLQSRWVTSPKRDAVIQQVRDIVEGENQPDLRIEGVSGVGKTRLVLEALRGEPFEAIVVYVPAADQFVAALLSHLTNQGRTAVVVIDNCDRRQHETFAQMLSIGTHTRLITVGQPESQTNVRTSVLKIEGLEREAMEDLLKQNEPSLWPEARRLVVEVAAGNIDYAIRAAGAIGRRPMSAGAFISEDDVRTFVTDDLPTGALFTAASALALFNRVGFDREVANELALLATHLRIPEADLREAARLLERQDLVTRQGRYRSVGPFPLAVYLARQAWDALGEQIVNDLMPNLSTELVEGLFARASEIGEFDVGTPTMRRTLAADGPLASFDAIAEAGSRLLPHFAVIAPGPTTQRLAALVSAALEEELRTLPVRRDLVWALEKLVWHSTTFEVAADALLRLATCESESWSNNASGTWVDLFGTMLPGTAALPEVRMQYLTRCAGSPITEARTLVVRAASHSLNYHETIVVSGELQGGAVVEPRGAPTTYGDIWTYQQSAIDILRRLAEDDNPDVAAAALEALVSAIHPVLEVEAVREHLASALATLPGTSLRRVRREIAGLQLMFDRVNSTDGRPSALQALAAALPPQSAKDALRTLAHTRSWDVERTPFRRDLLAAAQAVSDQSLSDALLDLLDEDAVPAAFEVGWVLAGAQPGDPSVVTRLEALLEGENFPALVGYLWGQIEAGDASAFDDYLGGVAHAPKLMLNISTRGPRTARASERVNRLLPAVGIQEGVAALFGWLRDVGEAELADLVRAWLPRLSSQEDYNALIDFLGLNLFQRQGPLDALDPLIMEVVERRRDWPDIGQKEWDWAQLAARWLDREPGRLARLIAEMIDEGELSGHSTSEETRLLRHAVERAGFAAWSDLMTRVAAGSWRLRFSFDRWLGNAVSPEEAEIWVAGDIERARILASVTSVGEAQITDMGRYLLDIFGADEHVAATLRSDFTSGGWSGNESERITRQIEDLRTWLRTEETQAVRTWVRDLIQSLEIYRVGVLEREAERGW